MRTWGYIKDACLAKLDMTADQAIEMGIMNKLPFYANEGLMQITQSVRAKRAYAEFVVRDEESFVKQLGRKYNLDDMSFLYKRTFNKDHLSLGQQRALSEYNEYSYCNKIVSMPSDFVFWGDDINYYKRDRYDENLECLDSYFDIIGDNKIMFRRPGHYMISYCANWFTFTNSTDDETELDIPDAIVIALPTYMAMQCYKLDDEQKASFYLNEFELLIARIEDNSYTTNKTMKIEGDW